MDNIECSSCGYFGSGEDFTKGNRTHNGHKGRCKKCKAEIDAKYRKKKDVMPKPFIPEANILINKKAYIGVLKLQKITDRRFGKQSKRIGLNFGMKAILSELKELHEVCYPETINNYKTILISLTSVMDVENLIYTFEKFCPDKITSKIIVGGFGVINIKLIIPYIDVAVFGRAEGIINEIINGFTFSNVWRKEYDSLLERKYTIRQPQYLLDGEVSVGCRNRCSYCQYAHIRQPIGKAIKYNPGKSISTQETDWHGLVVDKPGKYITAWDGWSEETRIRVNKHISDNDIINKLTDIGNNNDIDGTVSLKTYQIVGYPWETEQSVMNDIDNVAAMLGMIDMNITNKITLAFYVTPFGPEPLTPMQDESVDLFINWRELLGGMKIYYGKHIKAFIITAISGPFTLFKRMWINRADIDDIDLFKSVVFDRRIRTMPDKYRMKWLYDNKIIDIERINKKNSCDYLGVGGSIP